MSGSATAMKTAPISPAIDEHASGKTLLITGASDGIGAALAVELAGPGVRCALLARRREQLEQVAQRVRQRGGEALVLVADVSEPAQVRAAMNELLGRWGVPDLAVLNAGISDFAPGHPFSADKVLRLMDVNYGGVVRLLEALLPAMVARASGHLVVTSSLAAGHGLPTGAAYCASKAALDRLIEGLRVELAPHGLHFTLVAPGFVRTALTAKNRFRMPLLLEPDEAARRIARAIRHGQPRRLAFPWPMALGMGLARLLPEALLDLLLGWLSPRRAPRTPAPVVSSAVPPGADQPN